MIRYDLQCDKGHAFDGWFAGSAAYEKLERAGQLDCPHCGSSKVERQLMAPGIPAKSNRHASEPQTLAGGAVDPRQKAMHEMMRKLRRHVEANADYVGDRFAEEARKMHYEGIEPRGIYGEATVEDARALHDEGIEVHPLPKLPEEGN